jgi:hypothetical protein
MEPSVSASSVAPIGASAPGWSARRARGVEHPAHRRRALLRERQALGDRRIEGAKIGRHLGDVALQRRKARWLDPLLETFLEQVQTRDLAGDLIGDDRLLFRVRHREQLRRRRDDPLGLARQL